MLNFVNILEETPFQDKVNISDEMFGLQMGLPKTPIDFQYIASEAITSFDAIRKDITGDAIETISLSTSLIAYDIANNLHICNGQSNYATELDCGIYYYLVNEKYQSESFNIIDIEEAFIDTNSIIAISGLEFFDTNFDIPEYEKQGSPLIKFASEYGTNLEPLPFQYLADDQVTSFDLIKIDPVSKQILSTTSLSTSLVAYNPITGTHICNGLSYYADIVRCGTYYFEVNERYRSKAFEIYELLCPIIDNILISNAVEDDTAILSFDILLTGAIRSVAIDLTYTFSCPIAAYTETLTLVPTSQSITSNFNIATGIYGLCSITITNSVCSKAYTYNFEITEVADNCLELIGGGNLELIGPGCLELIT